MADRPTFDADLSAYISGDATLIAAMQGYITAAQAVIGLPQVIDLTTEDDEVKAAVQAQTDAAAAVAAALAALPPPPGKPSA